MIINKATGKGCSQSILSKTITRKLVAEGIAGKSIFSKGCYLYQVAGHGENDMYVMLKGDNKPSDEPLWTPSFIEKGIWGRAVSKFPTFGNLDRNVEKYLLPEMDEYIQSISDEELAAITRDFLIEQGVLNTPVAQHKGNTYYFNENGVFSLDKGSKLFPDEKRMKFSIFTIKGETCFNNNLWRKAVSRFEVGATLTECVRIFMATELVHHVRREPSPVERLVQYISPPVYERFPENKNESTFDRIRLTVGLPTYQYGSWEALQNEVKKYKPEIYRLVIQKLKKDRQFKRFGVPINFLKLSNVSLLHDFSLEFIFELKGQEEMS